MSYLDLTHSLADAFTALADEAQGLNDRRIVLEHKLRFAHEQLQYLADKYAPATPEIAETLAKLQLPPHTSVDNTSSVPLPRRNSPRSQHEVALVIRDGRRLASQLASFGEASKTTADSTRDTISRTSHGRSMSTALEQDFTVEGKKGNLQCPFTQAAYAIHDSDGQEDGNCLPDPTPHQPADPICAAMNEELSQQSGAVTGGAAGGKCPIRYMDQHSPEEIAHYVETHKHELPRSHEICLRRYQHNDVQIKKLDSKYGNIVSMIEDLGQLHQPMLPEAEQARPRRQSEVDRASNERVENWAQAITVTDFHAVKDDPEEEGDDRQSRFDRPLNEIRVGESPSRPWGIHVPVKKSSGYEDDQPFSPPTAPVRMHIPAQSANTLVKKAGKCPFDHTKLAAMGGGGPPMPSLEPRVSAPQASQETPFTPFEGQTSPSRSLSPIAQPTFITPEMARDAGGNAPQMVFTGPVFIGYPMEQAIQFMNQYRPNNA